jgi:hypothetical protein
VVANTHATQSFSGFVILDRDINATPHTMTLAYSNRGTSGTSTVQLIPAAQFHQAGGVNVGPAAAVPVSLQSSEVQVLVPV